MYEILALVGAIVLIVTVLQLRTALAMPFPRQRLRWIEARPPAALADLFDELSERAARLGFEPPRWVQVERLDQEAESMPLRALYKHANGSSLLWASAPVNVNQPHRLATYFSDHLVDGRTAISQPFDCYFELLQDDQLIARTGSEGEIEQQWQAHRRWVDSLGGELQALNEATLLQDQEQFLDRHRQGLIEQGWLRAQSPDLALPRLGLAWRMMRALRKLPKPAPDARPVPAERLVLLALTQEQVRHRAPPRDMQWALFLFSVALFMGLGAIWWDAGMAFAILVVVLIHELGHFLAMRAFGYRNVHMLALPLVGGVAMGYDNEPAALRRAWMSLMGPLPGILIGWLLLALVMLQGLNADNSWLLMLAMVFLFINYLNVLPVPPLDGAHVLESLLPPRWARLQTVLIGMAAILGALAAWHFDFILLTVIALLQLPALAGQWRLHGVERELAAVREQLPKQRNARLLLVLQRLDKELGLSAMAAPRINQALQVLARIDARPMGRVGRLLTSLVYVGLLLVPLLGLAWYASAQMDAGQSEQRFASQQARVLQWQQQAQQLSLDELVTALNSGDSTPAAASAAALRASEERLGQPLPPAMRRLYEISNGLPAVQLLPIEQVGSAQAVIENYQLGYQGKLHVGDAKGEWLEVPLQAAHRWWYLGGDEESPLFLLPSPEPSLPGVGVVDFFLESPSAHADLRSWLASQWADRQEQAQLDAEHAASTRALLQQWQAMPMAELLAKWQPEGLLPRLLSRGTSFPEPASLESMQTTQNRFDLSLPEDVRELYSLHDGFPPLSLLPLAAWQSWSASEQMPAIAPDSGLDNAADGGSALTENDTVRLGSCLVVGGWAIDSAGSANARLLWCPSRSGSAWIDLSLQRAYPSLHHWVLLQTARSQAW